MWFLTTARAPRTVRLKQAIRLHSNTKNERLGLSGSGRQVR